MKRAFGPGSLGAALLAVVLYVAAPFVHAIVHPDHGLSDAWSVRVSETAPSHSDKRSSLPQHHQCTVCQTLSAHAAAPPEAVVLASIDVEPIVHTVAPAGEISPRLHAVRPFGRAPPLHS